MSFVSVVTIVDPDNPAAYRIINESDFDPSLHTLICRHAVRDVQEIKAIRKAEAVLLPDPVCEAVPIIQSETGEGEPVVFERKPRPKKDR